MSRRNLAEALDTAAHILRYVDHDPAEVYRSELETQAIAQIRRRAEAVGDLEWRRAEQAGDLWRIDRSPRHLGAECVGVAWIEFFEVQRWHSTPAMTGIAETMQRLAYNLSGLALDAEALLAYALPIAPRLAPPVDVPALARELAARWVAAAQACRAIALERADRDAYWLERHARPQGVSA